MTPKERVAAAIGKTHAAYGFESESSLWDCCADAAMKELRQPSNRMLAAAASAMASSRFPRGFYVPDKEKHRIRYQAMMDVAIGWPAEPTSALGFWL